MLVIKETAQQIDELNIEAELGGVKPMQAIFGAKWSILAFVFASIIASLVFSNMLTPTYQASTTILLSTSAQTALVQPGAINQILDGDQFLADVDAQVKPNYTQVELQDQISSVLVHGTNTLALQATDSSSRRAKILADASAKVFLLDIERLELSQIKERQLELLQVANKADGGGIANFNDIVEELEQLKRELPTIKQSELSESELAAYSLGLRSRINTLEQKKQSLLSEALTEGQTLILAPAVRPRTPISPNLPRNVIFSAISALIVGVTLALALRPSRFVKSS